VAKTSRIEFIGAIDAQEDGFHLLGENSEGRFMFIVTRQAAVDGFPIPHKSPLSVETHVRRGPDVENCMPECLSTRMDWEEGGAHSRHSERLPLLTRPVNAHHAVCPNAP
jgi:hypothetical protein